MSLLSRRHDGDRGDNLDQLIGEALETLDRQGGKAPMLLVAAELGFEEAASEFMQVASYLFTEGLIDLCYEAGGDIEHETQAGQRVTIPGGSDILVWQLTERARGLRR